MKLNTFLLCAEFEVKKTSVSSFYKENNFKPCLTKQLLNMFKLWCEWGIRHQVPKLFHFHQLCTFQKNLLAKCAYTSHSFQKQLYIAADTVLCSKLCRNNPTDPRYLSADIICSGKRTVFGERGSRKTVSFEEQMMSKDK